jgi:predicted dehydrogenase
MPHDNPPPDQRPTRRDFVCGAAATATALAAGRVLGANDRIGIGLIGFGLIGKRHAVSFKDQPDVNLVAVAEAHRGRREEARTFMGGAVKGYADFRKFLDDREVDAVVIATPDHWHALMTLMACAAGKDVYVEKPLTLFVREGQWMIDVARRHKRVVQVGTQQRSGPHYARARELIRSGHIGPVVSVRMQAFRNVMPGFGRPPDQDPPADLDWDMFLGPAPLRKYNPNRGLYHFRWFWDTSGGQMTNLGHHALDILDWFLSGHWPVSVSSAGGRYALRDNGETPDTQDALFEFPGFSAVWSHREVSRGLPVGSSMEFFGTRGSLAITRSGFVVTPDRKAPPENAVPQFAGAHPVGGPKRVQEQGPPQFWTEPVKDESGKTDEQFRRHARNFLDCVRSRKDPVSDLESAHRVSTLCHLANISLRLRRQVRWDASKQTIVGDDDAARMLVRAYRAPWDSELKRLLGG